MAIVKWEPCIPAPKTIGGKGDNFMLLQIQWFKTKKMTIKGRKVVRPIEWRNDLCGIYPSYDEALFILKRTQGAYVKDCGIKGITPVATYSIIKTAKPVTTRKVRNHLAQLSEV